MSESACVDDEYPWRDEATLRQLYHDERKSISEIAELLGGSPGTIHKWMKRHEVERRDRIDATARAIRKRPAMFETSQQGYEQWRGEAGGETYRVTVHRLLAVAEYGFDAVRGKLVHHTNGCKFDNRPENIELLTRTEHMELHHRRGDYDNGYSHGENHPGSKLSREQVVEIKRRLDQPVVDQHELAAEYPVGHSTISKINTGEYWRHVSDE